MSWAPLAERRIEGRRGTSRPSPMIRNNRDSHPFLIVSLSARALPAASHSFRPLQIAVLLHPFRGQGSRSLFVAASSRMRRWAVLWRSAAQPARGKTDRRPVIFQAHPVFAYFRAEGQQHPEETQNSRNKRARHTAYVCVKTSWHACGSLKAE